MRANSGKAPIGSAIPLCYMQSMRKLLRIFWLSVLILFLELLLIRWVATEINIFAYLQNSILVVCFLGLGMGCMLSERPEKLENVLWPLVFLLGCMALPSGDKFFKSISLLLASLHDFRSWQSFPASNLGQLVIALTAGSLGALVIAGLLWKVMFSLGVFLGRAFSETPQGLTAYSVNILGSLVGVWLFALLSYLALAPWLWFTVLALLIVPLINRYAGAPRAAVLALVLLVALALVVGHSQDAAETRWSPYQKLELRRTEDVPNEFVLLVNNSTYQQIEDNREEVVLRYPEIFPEELRKLNQYDLPSRFHPDPKKVLIVGAGTGNDVAGLLRNTSAEITAVEIDPVILEFGRRLHPERPYDSARVHPVVNDARSFFQDSPERFDLIVFGLLDSHTSPVLTNARLDHFVYTTESLQAAYRLLAPQGVMVLLFVPQTNYILERINQTLAGVSGSIPLVFQIPKSPFGWGGTAFIVSAQETFAAQLDSQPDLLAAVEKWKIVPADRPVFITTDDWPYLYIEKPSIPTLFYLLALLLLLLWVITRYGVGLAPLKFSIPTRANTQLFALGAAFSLLEMFGLSRLAVLFGSTWFVNTAVISGVLIMILCANAVATLPRTYWEKLVYVGLIGCCALLFFFDFQLLASYPLIPRALAAGVLVSIPLFFSGILFARAFAAAESKAEALGANLFGALIGGVLQFLSFTTGIRALLIFVISFYLLAIITAPKKVSQAA